ncbi:HD-GYP domain-containing protein [Desulfofustis glycolicus]|uniref:Putative two-component system response regulator n=1 Tax=Desulfofustis glycolicus DSM 9705 TaxID=1121409 RepID=A0A1M5YJZ1_9BACT|nr:HD domain-containing phosphohydrolase [Desulfofustis glycolicus]MCB2217949.1 response regulator [Desulfobulbaceae bacterium]SHI12345.1 putative two-component system response regulator [Desulfofustis glycolicus DSM 9705]
MSQDRPLVLIVDDNPTNIDLLVATLKKDYRLGIAKRGQQAIDYARKFLPNLILLDIMMPEMDGYQVCTTLKKDEATASIPIIFITAMQDTASKTRGFEEGAVDYITKPFHTAEVLARVRTHVELDQAKALLLSQNTVLEQKVQSKTSELREMLNGSIISMARMVEIRDPYTAGHQQRVAQLACAIAAKMGLSESVIEGIRIASLLHDVGKIRIPVAILSRAGTLLEAELEVIKIHSQIGFEILKNIPFPWPVAQMVFQHHERLDGSGYPLGLREADLLLESKILTVADVTEAKSSFRPYRPALGLKATIDELKEYRGIYYDKDAVDACLELLDKDGFTFADAEDKEGQPILCVASPETINLNQLRDRL